MRALSRRNQVEDSHWLRELDGYSVVGSAWGTNFGFGSGTIEVGHSFYKFLNLNVVHAEEQAPILVGEGKKCQRTQDSLASNFGTNDSVLPTGSNDFLAGSIGQGSQP